MSVACIREVYSSREDGQKDACVGFKRDVLDIIEFFFLPRQEFAMCGLMPSVVPHSLPQQFMFMAWAECGASGNSDWHGLGVVVRKLQGGTVRVVRVQPDRLECGDGGCESSCGSSSELGRGSGRRGARILGGEAGGVLEAMSHSLSLSVMCRVELGSSGQWHRHVLAFGLMGLQAGSIGVHVGDPRSGDEPVRLECVDVGCESISGSSSERGL